MSQQDMLRNARARVFHEGVRVYRLIGPDDLYAAPSASELGAAYLIAFDGEGIATCTCPGFKYHGVCKHAEAARLLRQANAPAADTGDMRP